MNIDVQKISEVVITDETGKVVDRFSLGMISQTTMRDKTKTLEIRKAKSETGK